MDFTIGIDANHGETIEYVPEEIFEEEPEQYLLEEPLSSKILEDVDVLFLGNPQIELDGTRGFSRDELLAVKKFVAKGHGLFLTTGAGGDLDVRRTLGSIRVLYKVTGVRRFWNGVVFDSKHSMITKENLVVGNFEAGFVTRNIEELMLAESTFLDLTEEAEAKVLTEETAMFRYFVDGDEEEVGSVPLVSTSSFYRGRCVTLGSSTIFTEDPDVGFDAKDNKQFLLNCFRWLLFDTE
ncbi:MAG: hypothetical protein ACTSU5_19760 [Promethearchaeota archaeon]